jgi:hypothetical protein
LQADRASGVGLVPDLCQQLRNAWLVRFER